MFNVLGRAMGAEEELDARGFAREFMASVVVFLVALPLCMGIAIASDVPPALGLITGIVGGLLVGRLAGSPLQVSGPAAGLAVLIYEIVNTQGLPALAALVLMAGAIQLVAGVLKMGQWFRAVSPAVIRGMLAGIGVLIFASQFHVMLDDKPKKNGVANLATIPEAFASLFPFDGSTHQLAALIGVLTIGSLILWNVFRPKKLKAIPGALVAVLVGSGAAALMGFKINLVDIPTNLIAEANWITLDAFIATITSGTGWATAAGLALVASAETLLCAAAVDAIHDGARTDYDKELRAQGIGNMVCGVAGALPMTGVIVRSSANVDAGARTRVSAILHGAWLLGLVVMLPFVLEMIPTAALAAILVYTGYKLLNPKGIMQMWRFNRVEFALFMITLVGIVWQGLLWGVIAGIAASMFRLVVRLARLDIEVVMDEDTKVAEVELNGFATFLTLPKLADAMDALPTGWEVHVDMQRLGYIDHACIELLQTWEKSRASQGNTLVLGWDDLFARYETGPHPARSGFDGDDDGPKLKRVA
jgi:MFS superfamily sulfate permease-like transporter